MVDPYLLIGDHVGQEKAYNYASGEGEHDPTNCTIETTNLFTSIKNRTLISYIIILQHLTFNYIKLYFNILSISKVIYVLYRHDMKNFLEQFF